MRFRAVAVVVLALAVAGGWLFVRWQRRSRLPAAEPEAAVVPASPVEPISSPAPADAPPLASGLPSLLDRAFDGSLAVDPDVRPGFVTGDFTGDGATDLAVAVRPRGAESLRVLNADLPRFRLQDAGATDAASPPAPIAAGERLLAVLHGVTGTPWDGAGDRPAYLVRNGVGQGMRARPLSGVPLATRMRAMRAHAGDVIEQERPSGRGLLLWTGAAYTWAELTGGESPSVTPRGRRGLP
jgi:hypothetical protein